MRKAILLICSVVLISSCKKDPGPGGMATISGKLMIKDYDASFKLLKDSYYAQGENVYISYDGLDGVGSSVKTSYDGSYQFSYLRKGKYKVFAVGKDSSSINSNKTIAVVVDVDITDKKQDIKLPDIEILD